jgi:cyclin-dependent kinase 12/13
VQVGQGTYSNVYKRGTGRIVALKKLRFDTSESESVRFMAREMRILQLLDHPNVIRLDGVATSRMHRSIYLVFEFMYSDVARVVGRSADQRLTEPQVTSFLLSLPCLLRYIRSRIPLCLNRWCFRNDDTTVWLQIESYMQQLLSGLKHCHDRGILHRDIKGSNLLIDRHGALRIGDFGLANYLGRRVVTRYGTAPPSCRSAPTTTASASTSGAPAASSPRCSSASPSCPAEPR